MNVPSHLTFQMAQSLLDNNPELRAAQEEVHAESGDVLDAQKYLNPTIGVMLDGFVLDSSRGNLVRRLQPSLALRQEILTWGKREKRARLESVDPDVALARVRDLRRLLRFDLKVAYFNVVLAQRDLRLAREILQHFQAVVQLNRTRFEAGEISGGELRRTEAAEYSFFASVADAEVRLQNAKSELLAILGSSDLSQDFRAVDEFQPSFVPPSEQKLQEIALTRRPDLAADRSLLHRTELAIELEQARSKPNLTAFVGYRRELDLSGPVIGLELPLLAFNRNQGPIHRAQAERRRQENRLLLGRINVLKELKTALQRLEGGRKRIQALEAGYLDKARQAKDITESSYLLGEASLIEFLDAERIYSETMLLYNRALYEFEISRAQLEKAIGEEL